MYLVLDGSVDKVTLIAKQMLSTDSETVIGDLMTGHIVAFNLAEPRAGVTCPKI
jgi:hypothetical protein